MFIGQAVNELKDIQVLESVISFKKGERFFARDGVLYEQINAGNIKVLFETQKIKNEELKDFVVFENEKNKVDIEALIKSGDTNAYKDAKTEANSLKDENMRLKKELEEAKKKTAGESKNEEEKNDKRKGK